MAVTGTKTVSEIVTEAAREAGIVAEDEALSADGMANGIATLERMLKAWQNKRWLTWTYTSGSLALTTAASYALSPARPVRIISARYDDGSTETPMISMTRREYDDLPVKTTTGVPTSYHYDRSKESGTLYVWPVLASASSETIEFTYEREIEDIAASTDVADIPGEWREAVVYNLAHRLCISGKINDPRIEMMARESLADVLADDQEESVFFT